MCRVMLARAVFFMQHRGGPSLARFCRAGGIVRGWRGDMSNLVYILNGPNLNLLGTREPETYGALTLADIERRCLEAAARLGLAVEFRQRNGEGALVEDIHDAIAAGAGGIVINPAAYTHTSVAVHDALRAFDGVIIEVHLSNVHAREEFRHRSLVSPLADGIIMGLGAEGYELALRAMAWRLIEHVEA